MPEPLEDIQQEVIERLHAGEAIDREAILAAHPEHAEALGRFFLLLDVVEGAGAASGPEPSRLGEFEIIREIGRGGMGVVYEAVQGSLKRRVALKVLPHSHARNPRLEQRFRREAEAAGRLRHPGIVPVYSVGEAAGTPFFAMELVEGRPLSAILRERAAGSPAGLPPPGEEWRRWVAGIGVRLAEALAYAHAEGILHRDVKPANVIVDRDGSPRLTDFGLALDVLATGITATGESFGTPQYMSPEQVVRREAPVDERTDVYSLGVTLYELFCLRLPYEGTTAAELLAEVHRGSIVDPRKADPGMPPELAKVLLRALRRDPDERYRSAEAFANDLRAFLESRPVAAAAARPARRGRKGALAAAAVLLAGVALWQLASGRGEPLWPLADGSIPADVLVRLARGEIDGGDAILERWARPGIRMRGVRLAGRSDLDKVHTCGVWPGPVGPTADGGPAEEVMVVALWEVSVAGGPFTEAGFSVGSTAEEGHPAEVFTTGVVGIAPKDDLPVVHRAKVRILPRPDGWATEGNRPVDLWKKPFGASFTWTDRRTIRIVADLPEDYPAPIADAEARDAVARAVRPATLAPLDRWGEKIDDEQLRYFRLQCKGLDLPAPYPVAFEVDLHLGDERIGPADFGWVGAAPGEPTWRAQVTYLSFRVPELTEEESDRLWRKISEAESVRLVYRPSRRVAARTEYLDSYWDGSLEFTVPIARAR